MTAYLVTEDQSRKDLLQALIPRALQEGLEIIPGGGISGATSMARSLIVRRRSPVAMVVDSHSTFPDIIQERRLGLEELLGAVSVHIPWRVVVAVPELERVFFEDPSVLEETLSLKVPPTTSVRAEANPKKALEELFQMQDRIKNIHDLLQALSPGQLDRLRRARPIAEISDFLLNAHRQPAAVAVP